MIEITHIKWSRKAIGVALHKLEEGANTIKITVLDKNKELMYPVPIVTTKGELIAKYGVEEINKNNLLGVWIPLKDLNDFIPF
jgi:hypothetical protein